MLPLRAVLCAVICCAVLACSRKPSAAQPALEKFVDSVAHFHMDTELLTEPGAQIQRLEAGSEAAVEGTYEVPLINVGQYEWSRYKPETEERSGDDLVITVVASICMKPDEPAQGSCSRPNNYRFRGLMRGTGSDWKIAGLAFTVVSEVR